MKVLDNLVLDSNCPDLRRYGGGITLPHVRLPILDIVPAAASRYRAPIQLPTFSFPFRSLSSLIFPVHAYEYVLVLDCYLGQGSVQPTRTLGIPNATSRTKTPTRTQNNVEPLPSNATRPN